MHKYFYERSPIWQQVHTEEQEAVSKEQAKEVDGDSEEEEDDEETKLFAPVHFDPIDSRHLSSLPVLRARLTKLLKNCPHQMHTSNNLLVKIVGSTLVRFVRGQSRLTPSFRALLPQQRQIGDSSGHGSESSRTRGLSKGFKWHTQIRSASRTKKRCVSD